MDIQEIREYARGRWQSILPALGVPREYLNTNKHRACPSCGGKDRFRFTDWQGGGWFICNQCAPDGGSGFDFLSLVTGCTFMEAVKSVAGILGIQDAPAKSLLIPQKPPPSDFNAAVVDTLPSIIKTWTDARRIAANSIEGEYWARRGLDLSKTGLPDNLRLHPNLAYWYAAADGKPALLGHFPAIIAACVNAAGEWAGLHKTYLNGQGGKLCANHPETGETLPAKKMQARHAGSLKGAGIRLYTHTAALAYAEGIETALAARQMFGLPVWACTSAGGMRAAHIPNDVQEIFIIADNDENGTGFKAAHALAIRAIKSGVKANIWKPETVGFDALDELNTRKERQP